MAKEEGFINCLSVFASGQLLGQTRLNSEEMEASETL